MAPINPQIPVQNPNLTGYMGYSNPISPIEGDKSSGLALKGFADTLDAAIKGTDTIIKSDINSQVTASVDAERDAYTKGLETTRNATSGQPPVGDGNNIIPIRTAENLPRDVKNAPGYAQTLSDAYDAGKISQTYYYARLAEQAKTLRQQYPGYREEIDDAFKKATGVIPANAYVSSLVADINKAQSAGPKDDFNKTQDALRGFIKEGVPGAVEVYEGFTATGNVNAANKWMNQVKADEYTRKTRKDIRDDWKEGRAMGQSMALDDAETHASMTVANHFAGIQLPGAMAGKDISKIIAESSDRELKGLPSLLTDEQGAEMSRAIRASKMKSSAAIWNEWSTPIKDADGNIKGTWITQMGGAEKAKSILAAHMNMYDQVADALENKDYGLAHRLANMNRNMLEGTKNRLFTHKEIGPPLQTLQALKDMPPDWVKTYITSSMNRAGNNWTPDINEFVKQSKEKFFVQPLIQQTGEVATPKAAIVTAKAAGIKDGSVYNSIVDSINVITDPKTKPAIKDSTIVAFFSPENRGMLSQFSVDARDERGRMVPGRIAGFEKLTTPAIANAIAERAKENPAAGKMYLEWVEGSVGSELLNKEIKDLNTNQSVDGTRLVWTSDPKTNTYRFDLKWDQTAEKKPLPGAPLRVPDDTSVVQARNQIERLNRGIQGLANTYKAFGRDNTEAYVLDFIHSMGFKPTQNIEGYPAKMMNAIITTKMGQQKKSQ